MPVPIYFSRVARKKNSTRVIKNNDKQWEFLALHFFFFIIDFLCPKNICIFFHNFDFEVKDGSHLLSTAPT